MCNSFLFSVFRKILLTSYFTGTLLPDIAVLKKKHKQTNKHPQDFFFFFFTLHVLDNFMPEQLKKFSFALMEFGGI